VHVHYPTRSASTSMDRHISSMDWRTHVRHHLIRASAFSQSEFSRDGAMITSVILSLSVWSVAHHGSSVCNTLYTSMEE
jgi:hypothetical protein